jgi:hypothetical protein
VNALEEKYLNLKSRALLSFWACFMDVLTTYFTLSDAGY